jgi:hypothetical protein
MRIRTVCDARYRYIRNFTPETPFLAHNNYKETQYPAWNEIKALHQSGQLTPAQEFLCQPHMPEEELYDLVADPHEINNLVCSEKPEHRAALKKLKTALEEWIKVTDDKGRVFEPAKVVAAETSNRRAKPKTNSAANENKPMPLKAETNAPTK